ncbi:hypothetical protein VVR12_01620 [Rothia sp. LK2588]|uniref:hypothetical protein n=1 Tax=Rothia sp. LK2588 TaxID=3114369 RepID=UPI0034CF1B3E
MNAIEIITIIGVIASVLAALFGWWQILITRERSDVEWTIYKKSSGLFLVTNTGTDIAYKVTVEAWTASEKPQTSKKKKVTPKSYVKVFLPYREEHGPAPVKVPPLITPMVDDTPPSAKPSTIFSTPDLDVGWQFRRSLREIAEASVKDRIESEQSTQVSIKVVWRTRLGVWKTREMTTG